AHPIGRDAQLRAARYGKPPGVPRALRCQHADSRAQFASSGDDRGARQASLNYGIYFPLTGLCRWRPGYRRRSAPSQWLPQSWIGLYSGFVAETEEAGAVPFAAGDRRYSLVGTHMSAFGGEADIGRTERSISSDIRRTRI